MRAEPQFVPPSEDRVDIPWRRIARMGMIAAGAALLAMVVSFLLPKSYKAEARILPNLSASGSSSLLALAAGAGLGDFFSGQLGSAENPILTYPEILMSRTVLERTLSSPAPSGPPATILDALEAQGDTPRQKMEAGVTRLRSVAEVRANPRSGLIAVSAVTTDSVLSSTIVQRMLDELNAFNVQSRSSQGRATREFVEARMREARQEMAQAEQAHVAFRRSNLRIGNSPQLELEERRLQREVLVRSELFQLLARQYEMARIEEKRDTPTFSVIDAARPPVRKYRPQTLLNGAVAGIAALVLQAVFATSRRFRQRLRPVSGAPFPT